MVHARDTNIKTREQDLVNVFSSTMVVRDSKLIEVLLLIKRLDNYICLTSLTRAKLKEKMEFPT